VPIEQLTLRRQWLGFELRPPVPKGFEWNAQRRLAKREGRWAEVWARFAGSTGYEKVVGFLGLQEPGTLFEHSENRDSYPRLNADGEKRLRDALLALAELSPEAAKEAVGKLDTEHGWRRETVWARRGDAPLAQALACLTTVAAAKPLPSHEGAALAEAYVATGADVDGAAMRALAAAPRELDREAVATALRAVYLPWLEQGATALQELIRSGKVKLAAPAKTPPSANTILFVDGLRMDLARDLVRRLETEGVKVSLGWMWSGFPTVTATCKPMVSPVASLLSGPATTSDVLPLSPDERPATKAVLFKLMEAHGWETGTALLPDSKLWTETGRFDEEGHALGARLAQEKGGRPFEILSLREIQLSTRDILEKIAAGRAKLSTREWKDFLLRSIGLEPVALGTRAQGAVLLRMIPFVERNYNLIELGPRGTGKSHLFQQVSPYAHLVSGGKATVARMFVNMANGQRGLVCQYDVVCFDEVSGISFDQKDGVNIMKGYMESGEFSRGRESIRAEGSIVMVGNFDVDVQHQQRVGHLFGPMPPEMRNDTAFMDRIHCYLPGWDVPKINKELFTDRFGLVSDVLAECFSRLRSQSRVNILQGRVHFGGALSGRDQNAVNKTVSGLLKLLYPDPSVSVPDDDLEWAVRLALEVRRRVKEQQKRIGSAEFRNTQFSYVVGLDGVEKFVSTPELQSEDSIGSDPLPAGQVWAISLGGQDESTGLFRIEATESPGSGVRILNQSPPGPFRESARIAEQNLYSRSRELVGERNPREHEFAIQLRSFDAAKSGEQLGVGVLVGLCSVLLGKPLKGGLVICGGITLGGSIEPIHNPIDVVELAMEKGANAILVPVSSRRALIDLSDDVATKVQVLFYADAPDALRKALHD